MTEKATEPDEAGSRQHDEGQATDTGDDAQPHKQIGGGDVVVTAAEPELQPVGLFQLFRRVIFRLYLGTLVLRSTRFATKFEVALNLIGLVAAAAAGAAQPLMSLLFGKLTQAFVDFTTATLTPNPPPGAVEEAADHFRHTAAVTASYLVYLGKLHLPASFCIGMFVATYTYMTTWTYTGEVNAKRLRERYLQAVLRQDIAFFDKLGAGEVTTRIQTDCHLIQQGTSEKVALAMSYVGTFFCGFIRTIMSILIGKYANLALDQTAASGTLAEEVISTIRTAHAFGSQGTLCGLYNKFVMEANKYDAKQSLVHGLCMGAFYFTVYSAYGLAFYFGTTLLLAGDTRRLRVVPRLRSLIGLFCRSLSTIKNANQIFVVGSGEILESGTHDELMASTMGAYARLVEAQRLREAQAPNDNIAMGGSKLEELIDKPDVETVAAARHEVPLGRHISAVGSAASDVVQVKTTPEEKTYSITYLLRRMGSLNKDQWKLYAVGSVCSLATGSGYPAFGIVYGYGIQGFSEPDRHAKRVAGDRTALWFFLIAILSTFAIAGQSYEWARAAAILTAKIRKLSFAAMLRQDIEFFDREENGTGSLTARLSENAEK
ncbi:hypothetical protein EXIGLDRAFT_696518, partial [Exidia glandulosa HHB12029]